MAPSRVAVVGAGIGGLTAAAVLFRSGFAVDVYEQAKAFARVGAGIQMSANAMRILRGLGLEARVSKTAFRPRYWRNRNWDTGSIRFELPLGDAAEERYGAPYLLMHRADLHDSLASLVPAGLIHLDKRLVDLDQSNSGVELRFADGSAAAANIVIAADGVHSRVRELTQGEYPAGFTGRVAYRATFQAELVRGVTIDDCTKWWGPDRHIVIYYTSHDRGELYFVTSVPEPNWKEESWSAVGDLHELRSALSGFHNDVAAVLAACPVVHKWALLERDPLPSWVNRRVVLLGDACHPMTPYMAQGAAMAMEDAVVLGRCLSGSSACEVEKALHGFEQARKDRTSQVQLHSHQNQWMKQSTDPLWVYGYDAWSTPLS
jgi:salicylate hydroxylase/6-hydroxynicotinate 3-monooxygenase